ncbi:hypothetical protein BKA62DRAFT_810757 [Auriculariales sp. MPI-PUGE-AT-0066]|nr:hypothetical protein BKA62DRAFT_810757 [Auriculariales sp. MPI-PUGE-AT-0066]
MVYTPHPVPSWENDDPTHPGWAIHGVDDTPGRKGYFIHLQAQPGKEALVSAFLQDINAGVEQEPGTGPWFALRFSQTAFGIFEVFPDAAARQAHNVGPGGQQFLRSDELRDMLEYPAQVFRLDVEHGKFGTLFGQKVGPVVPW